MTSQIGAAFMGLVQAVIALAVLFGVHLTSDQLAGINVVLGSALSLVYAILHIQVTTKAAISKAVEAALATQVPPIPPPVA